MIQHISMQAYVAQKMSVLRVLEINGADEAKRKYPEFDSLIRALEGLNEEQLQLFRQSLVAEMLKFTGA